EANTGKGLQEAGAARSQHDVAGERHVGAGPRGDAVDGADNGLFQGSDELYERVVGLLQAAARVGHASLRTRTGLRQILAGAEGAAGTGQHDHATLRLTPGGF